MPQSQLERSSEMTTTQKCPCCLQPAEELRLLPEDSMLPDEPICRDCFYEYRAQNDETEYDNLKVSTQT